MSDYFSYTPLVANTVARAADVNARFQAVSAGFDLLPAPTLITQSRWNYVTAGGTANALTITLSPAPSSYVEGLSFRMKVASTNTGSASINVNGLGVKNLLRIDGTATQSGDLPAGAVFDVIYDGTSFRLMRGAGTGESISTPASVLAALLTVDGSGSGLDADTLRGTIPSAIGLSLLSGASQAAVQTIIGVSATGADTTYAFRANNLSDLTNAGTARTNLGLGSAATLAAGSANGVATLGADGKVPTSQLPAIALVDVNTVASEAAQLALSAQEGDVAIRTDLNKSYIHNGGTAGTMADWSELLTPTDSVLSVNGFTGAVTLTASNITSSATGDVSATTVQGAIAELASEKAALSGAAFTGAVSVSGTVTASGVTIPADTSSALIVGRYGSGVPALIVAGSTASSLMLRGPANTNVLEVTNAGVSVTGTISASGKISTTHADGLELTGTPFPNMMLAPSGWTTGTITAAYTKAGVSADMTGGGTYVSQLLDQSRSWAWTHDNAGVRTVRMELTSTGLSVTGSVTSLGASAGFVMAERDGGDSAILYHASDFVHLYMDGANRFYFSKAGAFTASAHIVLNNASTSLGGAASVCFGTYVGGAFINTPTGNSGYLAAGNNGVLTWAAGGVSVTGTITASGQVTTAGYRDAGGLVARFEGGGAGVPTGSTGVGVEIYSNSGIANVQAYNRTTSAVAPLTLTGSGITLTGNTSVSGTLSATGAATLAGTTVAGSGAPLTVNSTNSNANKIVFQNAGANVAAIGASASGAILTDSAFTARLEVTTSGVSVTGALTYGGVTLSNSVTGTGSMVLSASPTFTGTPAAPTAAIDTNTTQVATTAFVDRLRDVPIAASLGERGKAFPTAAGQTLNTGYAAGTTFTIYNDSASAITITQGAGLTLRQAGTANTGSRTLAARGLATVWCRSTTEYLISGPGVS